MPHDSNRCDQICATVTSTCAAGSTCRDDGVAHCAP